MSLQCLHSVWDSFESIVPVLIPALTAISLLVIACQLLVNHDLRCRENALQELIRFDASRTRDLWRQISFLFDLTSEQMRNVIKLEPFAVDVNILKKMFPEKATKPNNGHVTLTYDFLLDLRFAAVSSLNGIEVVGQTYKHGIANRLILSSAFYDTFINENRLGKWIDVMNAFGEDSWPVIRELPVLMKPVRDNKAILPATSVLRLMLRLLGGLVKPIK